MNLERLITEVQQEHRERMTERGVSWDRVGRDTIVNGDYYITRTWSAHGWYYNGWKGKHDDRDLREHIDAGWNVDAVKGACERHAEEGK